MNEPATPPAVPHELVCLLLEHLVWDLRVPVSDIHTAAELTAKGHRCPDSLRLSIGIAVGCLLIKGRQIP